MLKRLAIKPADEVIEFAPGMGITAALTLQLGPASYIAIERDETVARIVGNEGAVPLLGLAKGPAEYPLSAHVYALASHLVFGVTAEFVRRTVRRAL